MANVTAFTDTNFDDQVLKASEPVLVDFGAAWCMPCQALAPVVEALAAQYAGKVRIGTVDTDKNPKVSIKYRISALPTLVLYKGGEVVEMIQGPRPQHILAAMLDKHLAASANGSAAS